MHLPKKTVILSVISTGISSVSCQIIIVREFLSHFHGNEITISMVISLWLLLTALGSLLARPLKKVSYSIFSILSFILSIWPLIQLLIIRYLSYEVVLRGKEPGFYKIFFLILFSISLYCIMVGFILPYSLTILKSMDRRYTSSKIYILDNIGDTIGGAIFSFALVYLFKPFRAIAITSSILMVCSFLILVLKSNKIHLIYLIPIGILFYVASLSSGLETHSLNGQYGKIIRYLESPYGRIVVTKEQRQLTFWESGIPLYSSLEIMEAEEKVHYPLSQLDRAENLLLISGGLGCVMDELQKYHPKRVDYVEMDPVLIRLGEEMGFLKKTPFLNLHFVDGVLFLKRSSHLYDAIIMDVPEPDTFQTNRFFSREFFSLVKGRLKKEGIFCFSISYYPHYISKLRKKKLSIIHTTAKEWFRYVVIIPSNRAYFLCSERKISTDIPFLLRKKGIHTRYVEGFYWGDVTPDRLKKIKEVLVPAPINTDFKPSLMKVAFMEWFSMQDSSPVYLVLIIATLLSAYLIFIRKGEYVLFTTGFLNMSVEILLIFLFQILYGYVYLKIGALVTVFLFGLLPGAILGSYWKGNETQKLRYSEFAILLSLILLHLGISYFRNNISEGAFLLYGLSFSLLCGMQFPLITRIIGERWSPAATCLAADLMGAAFGSMIVGTMLVPIFGITFTIKTLILIKLSSIIISNRM